MKGSGLMYGRRSYGPDSGVPFWFYPSIIVVFSLINQAIAHGISEDNAIRAAEGSGYTDVKLTDRHTFLVGFQGCGMNDLVMFDVTGTDANGNKRTFVVCDGLFKAATVRFK